MKTFRLFVVLCMTLCSAYLFAEPVQLNVPDLFSGIFDQYAYNFVNTSMAGRGHTGISVRDRINVATQNPAAFRSNRPHFAIEIMVKNEVYEFNEMYWFNAPSLTEEGEMEVRYTETNMRYQSPFPFSYFGVGFAPVNNFNFGLSYSLNRSIKYSFMRRDLLALATNRFLIPRNDTYPTFMEHQLTFTANRQFGNFTIGLNNNLLIHRFEYYRNEGRLDYMAFTEFIYRPQIGVLYELRGLQVGASFTPKTENTMERQYIRYEVVHQTNIKTGLSVDVMRDLRVLFDTDINLYSETSEHFDDRITYKFGLEKMFENYSLKVGFIHSPSIFSGEHKVPNYFLGIPGTYHPNFKYNIPFKGNYRQTEMNMLTFGTSMEILPRTNLHLAMLTDLGDVGLSSFMASLDIDLSVFERRRR